MSVSVTMPQLGESVTEGTVTRWLKQIGDTITVDEPLVEVSTDKVDTEIPAPVSGVLLAITAAEDDVVLVGGELGVIGAASEATSTITPAAVIAAPVVAAPVIAAPVIAAAPAPPVSSVPVSPRSDDESNDSYVTPLVRKLASDNDIDLSALVGTGVGGRIRKSDVLAAAEASKAAASRAATSPTQVASSPAAVGAHAAPEAATSALRGRTENLSRLRRVIADRMVTSLQTSAQLTSVVEVDVTRITHLRARAKASLEANEGVKLTYLPFFAKACVEALKQFPQLNASIDIDAGTVTYHDGAQLGIAVDTDRGLLVPVVRDAGDLNLVGLARKIADIAERTRTNKVAPDELSGGTFTLTNTGSRGALFDTPIINQPQVAILGTGAVVKRPVVVTDENGSDSIAVRSMVYLALTYDHRLVDGADAARFLVAIKSRLEDGSFDAELGLG